MPYTKKLNQYKDEAGMSNHDISERSGVPLGTVNRIRAGTTENSSFEAIAAIVRVLGGSLDELAGIPTKSHHKHHSSEADERIIALYEKQLDNVNAIHEKRIHDKNNWIKILFALVSFLVVVIVTFFAVDVAIPDRGWHVTETAHQMLALLR